MIGLSSVTRFYFGFDEKESTMARNSVFKKPLEFLENVGECTIEQFDEEFSVCGSALRHKMKQHGLITYDAQMKYIYKIGE